MKTAVAAVATPLPISSCQPLPFAISSRTERLLAPSETIALSSEDSAAGFDHHLAADGEPDAADSLGIDVRLTLQERNRRVDVPLALPAEGVRVALALALAAAVEEQDAVSVAREQLGPLLGGGAARERDHRGSVARPDVPALQEQAVGRPELHVLVGSAEVGSRNR